MSAVDAEFTPDERERARAYHRPLYSRSAPGRRARRRLARRSRLDCARAVALLPARVALAGRRGRRLRRPRHDLLERGEDTARVLARLAARAAVGLLDPERGWLARRPRQGARRGDRACGRRVGRCGCTRSRLARLVGAAGRSRARTGRARSLVRRSGRPRADLQPLPAARGRDARGSLAGAVGASRCPGAKRARRRREPPHDEGQRLRVGHRQHAPRRSVRHAAAGGRPGRGRGRRRARAGTPARSARREADRARHGGSGLAVAVLWAMLGTRIADPRSLPEALLVLLALELVGFGSGRGALASLRARRRPLLARPHRGCGGVRPRARRARRGATSRTSSRRAWPICSSSATRRRPSDSRSAGRGEPPTPRDAIPPPRCCLAGVFALPSERGQEGVRGSRDREWGERRVSSTSRTSCSRSTRTSTRPRGGSRASSPARTAGTSRASAAHPTVA